MLIISIAAVASACPALAAGGTAPFLISEFNHSFQGSLGMKLSCSFYFFLLFLTCVGGRALKVHERDVDLEKSTQENTLAGNIVKRGEATSSKSEDIPKVGERGSIIAKVCFAQCSTSRLALGSPGCLFVCLSPCPK